MTFKSLESAFRLGVRRTSIYKLQDPTKRIHANFTLISNRFQSTSSQTPEEKPLADSTVIKLLNDDSHWLSQSTKGVGQVVFVNHSLCGAAMLGGLFVGDLYLGLLATLGTFTSTIIARNTHMDQSTLKGGLWSYNGCLVGCATSVFLAPESVLLGVTCTVAGAAASTFVTAALGNALQGRMPQWTYAFNITTLTMLLYAKPFNGTEASTPPTVTMDISTLVSIPFKGISQIYVVDNAWTGAILTGSMAYWYSPKLASHLVMGSAVGSATGFLMGVPIAELTMGLYGFNSALTSAAVAVFFVPTTQSTALSIGGAATTAVLFGALKTVFGECFASPALTLPFCLTMSGCYLLQNTIPGLSLAKNPHSPEKNQA